MSHRRLLLLTLAAALAALLGSVHGTWAKFADATVNDGNTITATNTYRAPAGTRSVPPFHLTERASGTANDRSWPLAFAGDSLTQFTLAWPTTQTTAGRWVQWDFPGFLPGTLAVTGATLRMRAALYVATGSV